MQRLGIFGGTFNPPHKGHIYIASEAMKGANLDKVLFIPCGNPPHKVVEGDALPQHRFEMTRLAIRDFPRFEITDLETRSADLSYTAKTLEKLVAVYPTTKLCFILGGDSLRDMEKWYKPDKIFKLAEIVALKRGGIADEIFDESAKFYRQKYGAEITSVDVNPVKISSSEIRRKITSGEAVQGIVDKAVLDYIRKFKIYREKN